MPFDGARADEQVVGDLAVGVSVLGQSGDPSLLACEFDAGADRTVACRFPCRQNFPLGAFGEAVGLKVREAERSSLWLS
ncbi:hypothetical protein [Streptomyces sp. NPDC060035]|uniref:hypothetical protein n=1 Tax=Streptomyces sp. NPDC060035 TaxID=3347044 RepID=UPI00369A6BE5